MEQSTTDQVPVSIPTSSRRTFLKQAGVLGLAAGAASVLRSPFAVEAATSAAHEASGPYTEHMDIMVAFPSAADDIKASAQDPVLSYLEQKFNVTIKPVELTYANYDQLVNLWAASGQLPDVFFSDEIGTANYFQWVTQGLIRPLPTDLSAYPYLNNLMHLADLQGYKANGQFYFLPRELQPNNVLFGDRGVVVRKDWMAQLGLKDPQTWAQFVAMLTAFVQKNPEHNKNVTGITSTDVGTFISSIFGNWDPYVYWWHKGSKGQWVSPTESPEMLAVIQEAHQLYTQGLIDKDYGNPNNDPTTKFIEGQAGVIVQQPKHLDVLQNAWNQVHKDKKFTDVVEILMMPPGPDGHRYAFEYWDFWSESFFNANVSDAKMARILALYDYLISPAGRKLVSFGFEGKDYKIVGGAIASLHPASWTMQSAYPSTGVFSTLVEWGEALPGQQEFKTTSPVPAGYWTPESWRMYVDYVSGYRKITTVAPINWAANAYAASLPHGIDDLSTAFVQAVAASNPEQVWAQYVQEENTLGLAKVTALVNQKFK